ncbi:U6 snRNA phosphodiesterase 1 [Dillenia turbinata]|uniref:U6 snRNA phosphodiesterase n=1 Tax=Dillenia turbinata TaxID=194707 RepID=A0AAN8VJW5_9MAGN
MEALRASYADSDSDADYDSESFPVAPSRNSDDVNASSQPSLPLPPPPLSLLNPPNCAGIIGYEQAGEASRIRSFPHIEGNYALHVYIPVYIPPAPRKEITQFLTKVAACVPGIHVVDVDMPLNTPCGDLGKLEQVALGREFHISLGRTVPIRIHQIDTIVAMLRQKLQSRKRYWIDFSKWEVFVNDDLTRTFLSIEVIKGGLAEITKQINDVNEVYKLHNLPEFYKDPRPHISLAWALGDIRASFRRVVDEEMKKYVNAYGFVHKSVFTCRFGGIKCKIGNKTYDICRSPED